MSKLGELAALVNTRRKVVSDQRLILQVSPDAKDVLTAAAPSASIVPAIPVGEGTGLTYRHVEVHDAPELMGKRWRLLDGGELLKEGEL